MSDASQPLPWAATRRALADALGQVEGVLPGSVVVRRMRCGKAVCACQTDPEARHGPYIQWTRTVNGKTTTRYLNQAQHERYQQLFDNARQLKDLVAKLEIATVHAVEEVEGWSTPAHRSADTARGNA
jgi:hypothetical protein